MRRRSPWPSLINCTMSIIIILGLDIIFRGARLHNSSKEILWTVLKKHSSVYNTPSPNIIQIQFFLSILKITMWRMTNSTFWKPNFCNKLCPLFRIILIKGLKNCMHALFKFVIIYGDSFNYENLIHNTLININNINTDDKLTDCWQSFAVTTPGSCFVEMLWPLCTFWLLPFSMHSDWANASSRFFWEWWNGSCLIDY